ncbi:hypothetical protein LTR99_001752 [Exophiala xenobiotica]|uniref:Carboxymuconolactone decarboxylase-like domain-containing protein n=1 Tax=Vermiconidia calcicola TaxID=1690605 RepID=A0AAV9Q5P3_9PEZI|nr:hypothetical protein LTR92_007390 [Exophiala xenobiotica]KAK5536520.1 hypothetical protein LTR25_005194 [Vermiconidia calcicola]KAK5543339.1 hypothetical protein LTR23_004816 [Chaetothyriales sp. CCFEE 6169]KAK5212142.1 hypothetical protein LTR41_002384 [Exophiala xenobiotica]KAK5225272.1 hypothetical protein LTR47_009525 [Exophiala xenobiotica]
MASPVMSYQTLFQEARDATPRGLPVGAWYIIVAATLITADGGSHLGELYQFVLNDLGSDSTLESRQNVSRRLRAVIAKAWTLVGMPRASDGLFALLRVEDPKDAAQDWDRAEFARQPEKAIQRTQAWWQQVFGDEVAGINKSYETNPDFAWTVEFAVYGLYLADLSVLGPIENELVILASVMGQGAQNTTRFHLRGTRRIGVGAKDAVEIQRVIEMVGKQQSKDPSSWPRFQEVEHLFP